MLSESEIAEFPWHEHVRAGLEGTLYGALSTEGPDGPWVNPVYFAYDDLTFYFISQMHSRHMTNIVDSPRVALAAFRTDQPTGAPVAGVQLRGTATFVDDIDVPEACDVYFAREGALVAIGADRADPADYRGSAPGTWKFVRIEVDELSLFSSEHFDEERMAVPLDAIRGRLS